jgi:membrane protein YdbS with pleckstrin-like domain
VELMMETNSNQMDSNVIYVARLHWIIFVWPFLLLCLGFFLGIEFWSMKEVSIFLVVFALIWLMMTWVTYLYSSLTIKKNQVILRTGFLVRQTIDLPMTKIESIDIRQSIGGSIFQYGMLMITGTGGTRNSINFLDKPLTCRRYIEQLIHP